MHSVAYGSSCIEFDEGDHDRRSSVKRENMATEDCPVHLKVDIDYNAARLMIDMAHGQPSPPKQTPPSPLATENQETVDAVKSEVVLDDNEHPPPHRQNPTGLQKAKFEGQSLWQAQEMDGKSLTSPSVDQRLDGTVINTPRTKTFSGVTSSLESIAVDAMLRAAGMDNPAVTSLQSPRKPVGEVFRGQYLVNSAPSTPSRSNLEDLSQPASPTPSLSSSGCTSPFQGLGRPSLGRRKRRRCSSGMDFVYKRFGSERSVTQNGSGFHPKGAGDFLPKLQPTSKSLPPTVSNLLNMPNFVPDSRLQLLVNITSQSLRQWSIYEWFYSSLDKDYFLHNEFQECLNALGLSHIRRLSRTEWSILRSIMGCPRRLSRSFLQEERAKLEYYRRIVRSIQNEQMTHPKSFPYKIPPKVSIGQTVIAFHRKLKLIGTAIILSYNSKDKGYRIQFNHPVLGVCCVRDVDLVSVNFSAPTSFAQNLSQEFGQLQSPLLSPDVSHPRLPSLLGPECQGSDSTEVVKTQAESQKEARLQLVVSLTKLLKRKEALLNAAKEMNDQAEKIKMEAEESVQTIEYPTQFKQQYAWLVVNIEATNRSLEPALQCLRLLNSNENSKIKAGVNQQIQEESLDNSLSEESAQANRLLKTCNASAALLVAHTLKSSPDLDKTNETEISKELVQSCTALALALQKCLEGDFSTQEVNQVMCKALEQIKPKYKTNSSLFQEIENSVAMFKTELMLSICHPKTGKKSHQSLDAKKNDLIFL